MPLKIFLKPLDDEPPFYALGRDAQIIDMDTGVDISKAVRNINISLLQDEWATATLECDIGELELIGVDVEKVFPIIEKEE